MKKIAFIVMSLMVCGAQASFFSNGTKVPASKADVLVVMDNSGSMTKYANRVGGGVAALIKELQYNSINLALITNGPFPAGQGPFRTTPVKGTLDEVLHGFINDVNALGFDGSANEEFYSAILKTTEPEYAKFYRQDADLIIYVVTDEDEQRMKSPLNTLDFIRELKSRLNISKAQFNLLTESKKCSKLSEPQITQRVLFEAVRALGGQAYDICPQPEAQQ